MRRFAWTCAVLAVLFTVTGCEPDECDGDPCRDEGAYACDDTFVLQCTLVESDDDDEGKKCRALVWREVKDCSDGDMVCIEGACTEF